MVLAIPEIDKRLVGDEFAVISYELIDHFALWPQHASQQNQFPFQYVYASKRVLAGC